MRAFLLLAACGCCFFAQAQFRIGVEGGYSRVMWRSVGTTQSLFGNKYSTSGLDGFQIGLVSDLNLSGDFLLRPSLLVTGRGTTFNEQTVFDTSCRGIWIQYLEVPVELTYQRSLGEKMKGFAGGGFYAARAFRGVEKGEEKTIGGEPGEIWDKVKFGNHNDGPFYSVIPITVHPFDFGFTLLAGVERNNLQLRVTYSRGLKTVLPNSEPYDGNNFVNSGITVSAAYLVPAKQIKHWFH